MGLVNVHNVVGTLVVVAYVVLAVLYGLGIGGRAFGFTRMLSRAAAALLLVQYVIGFVLLGTGSRIGAQHFLIALLAIVSVGLEHAWAPTRGEGRGRAVTLTLVTVVTVVLVIAAHVLGSAGIGQA